MVPYPAQGHINPMMQLAKRLSSYGVHVTVMLFEHYTARIAKAQGNNALQRGSIRLMGISDRLPDGSHDDRMAIAEAVEKFGGPLEEALQQLMRERASITCIIGDCHVARVRDVANKLHIPRVAFWSQSATTLSIHLHTNDIIDNGFNPFENTVQPFGPKEPMDLIGCIPGVPPLHPAYLPFYSPFGLSALQWLERWRTELFGILHEAFAVMGNSFEELEPTVFEALPNVQPVGPLLPPALLDEESAHEDNTPGTSLWREEDCIEWLDLQPLSTVLYIAFGSLAKLTIAQLQEIAFGLLASQQHFLWVMRSDSVVESETTALESLPHGFLAQIKEKGKIISWAPQALVLAHPSVCGFFSHCGWNSTLESVSLGVPMLGWPQSTDQITNCWMVVNQWKVGLELKRDHNNNTDRVKVEKAVRELMDGQSAKDLRTRAAELRAVAKRNVKSHSGCVVVSHNRLEHFVNQLFQMS